MDTEQISQALSRLSHDYPLEETQKEGKILFRIKGVEENFRAYINGGECVLSTNTWHEHFAAPEYIERFMRCLLTGEMEIVVTYCGETPVSHWIQTVKDGKLAVVSKTANLILFPFWKKKTQKKMEYKFANKGLERTVVPPAVQP